MTTEDTPLEQADITTDVTTSNEPNSNQPDIAINTVTSDNQPGVSTDDQPDVATNNQPDVATDNQPDVATDDQPDVATYTQPDVAIDNQPDAEGWDEEWAMVEEFTSVVKV